MIVLKQIAHGIIEADFPAGDRQGTGGNGQLSQYLLHVGQREIRGQAVWPAAYGVLSERRRGQR